MTTEPPDRWEVVDGGERIRWTPSRVKFEDQACGEYANLPHALFDAAVEKRLAQRGMRAVPIQPQPDPACVEARHMLLGDAYDMTWIDNRTLGTLGCEACRRFWGEARDTGSASR